MPGSIINYFEHIKIGNECMCDHVTDSQQNNETIMKLRVNWNIRWQKRNIWYLFPLINVPSFPNVSLSIIRPDLFSSLLYFASLFQGKKRTLTWISHYEIPCWRYGGVPSDPGNLISVIKQIKTHHEGNKHLLVHCR